VAFLLQSLAVASIAGTILAVWGFRKPASVRAAAAAAALETAN
jgi:hypothetical protein